MLRSRIVVGVVRGSIYMATNRGYLQGGVLSPILWFIVVDSLLSQLPGLVCNDISILVSGMCEKTISELLMTDALKVIGSWYHINGLIRPTPSATLEIMLVLYLWIFKLGWPQLPVSD